MPVQKQCNRLSTRHLTVEYFNYIGIFRLQPSSLGHGAFLLIGEQLSEIGRWLVTSLTWMRANMMSDAQGSV